VGKKVLTLSEREIASKVLEELVKTIRHYWYCHRDNVSRYGGGEEREKESEGERTEESVGSCSMIETEIEIEKEREREKERANIHKLFDSLSLILSESVSLYLSASSADNIPGSSAAAASSVFLSLPESDFHSWQSSLSTRDLLSLSMALVSGYTSCAGVSTTGPVAEGVDGGIGGAAGSKKKRSREKEKSGSSANKDGQATKRSKASNSSATVFTSVIMNNSAEDRQGPMESSENANIEQSMDWEDSENGQVML
jgi:hypothetical protein